MSAEQQLIRTLVYVNQRIAEIDSDMSLADVNLREILSGMREAA